MKKQLLWIVVPIIIMVSCSKSNDGVVVYPTDTPARVELDLPVLNSYIGKSFDDVHKTLEKNAFDIKTSLGDRYFDIVANSGIHNGLTVELKEVNKIINVINITYDGGSSGNRIGDPYENELWYYMLLKVQGIYGPSSTRIYVKGSTTRLLSSNEVLIQFVKDNGFTGALYASTWNNTANTLTVLHSDAGRFILQIKAK